MSKVTEAMKKAEEERAGHQSSAALGFSARFLRSLKEELQEELRSFETVVGWRSAKAAQGDAPEVSEPASPVSEEPAVAMQAPAVVAQEPQQPKVELRVVPERLGGAGPDHWQAELARLTQELAACEQQAARQTSQQALCRVRMASLDELKARMKQERQALGEDLQRTSLEVSALEARSASLSRQLEALLESQLLANQVRVAQRDLQHHAEVVAQMARSQLQRAEELTQYQQREQILRQRMEELKSKLESALSMTGAPPGGQHQRSHRS
jgi:hypothetical protein